MPKLTDIIEEMDPGLERATLRILNGHQGKDKTISRAAMVIELGKLGFGNRLSTVTFERQVRRCIVRLRKTGHLICSSSGDGGYYLAADLKEYDDFSEQEYRSKIIDMSQTLIAMDKAAKAQFGEGYQMGMF